MSRVLLLVLDSFGVGGAADAAAHGDAGADTLGHIAATCAAGGADVQGLRTGPLHLPNLEAIGLGAAAHLATGAWPAGFDLRDGFRGTFAACDEESTGKDTPSGHWEMTGLPVPYAWGLFPPGPPSFPPALLEELVRRTGIPGILGNKAVSGTVVLDELGAEHVATGKPICYTSADSVFQIAAHEEHFGLSRLYEVCRVARELVDAYQVGRVIARPFVGSAGAWTRTTNRRDYTTPPHGPTLLDVVVAAGRQVHAVGKISDIFAGRGVSTSSKGGDNEGVFETTSRTLGEAKEGDLVFSNFVDFDSRYGHRRDVAGYAAALEALDLRLPELTERLQPDDLLLLTADHGCDPTWRGTDHTRERIPVLAFGPQVPSGDAGIRPTFADIGQTAAAWLGLPALSHGTPLFRHP
jgi:phosphopentomutase